MKPRPFESPDAFWRRCAWTACMAAMAACLVAAAIVMAGPAH